ncbi:hypothetical protein BS47DRAFT_1375821 [Hydnum rufescens UP504]|uniref:RRM domain-containing protein n=1 Tax=Hydnum rufescens UP504 TaxID=1448309 RepID=A0A9P6B3S5_9AGAM|nr:hypothetical protein BS47DRAFT_1375821 [Hydnum rufescens UP504]
MPKSKASLGVAPDVAEASPALAPSKPRGSALKKSILMNVKEKDSKTKKRPAAQVELNDEAPTSSKRPKSTVQTEEEDGDQAEEIHLHGFSSGSDSSDEDEDDGVDSAPVDLGKLPTIAKDDATVKRKLEKAKRQPTTDRGVLYLARIPHGFYEDEMRGYFSQFGTVTRLRLSRNKKTGRSKHYGFIEFDSSSVAQIVSETMDNYLLLGHILVCKVIPKDELHPELWVGANRKWRKVPTDRLARVVHNRVRTEEEQGRREARLLKRQEEKQKRILDAGIDYDISAAGYSLSYMYHATSFVTTLYFVGWVERRCYLFASV